MAEVTTAPATNGTDPATRPLPEFVAVGTSPRFSPNELRMLKAITGKALTDLVSDPADIMQATAYCRLRRDGYNVTWEQAGDVLVDMTPPEVDPTNGSPLPMSQPSAATGE